MIGALCSRRVIVGLGSNLGDRAASLTRAVARLAAHPAISIEARSSVVATAALTEPGAAAQPEFLNAAVRLRTTLAPEALLDVLLDT